MYLPLRDVMQRSRQFRGCLAAPIGAVKRLETVRGMDEFVRQAGAA